jgi:hypothetical protein
LSAALLLGFERKSPRPFRKHTHCGFHRPIPQPVIEHPQRCVVPNEQHLLTITLGGKLLQENAPPHRYLLVTLAVGEWHANGSCAWEFLFRAWAPFKVSVVALTQPCVVRDGYRATYEDPVWLAQVVDEAIRDLSHAREDAIVLSRTI